MSDFTVEVKGLEEFIDDINEVGSNANKLFEAALNNSTRAIKLDIEKNIIEKDIKYQGRLLRSVTTKIRQKPLRGIVATGPTAKEYASVIEYGRRPGKYAPIDPLEKWVRLKGIKKMGLMGLSTKGKSKQSRSVYRNIAYAISRKMYLVGTKPRPYFFPAIEKNKNKVFDEMKKAADIMIKKLAGK